MNLIVLAATAAVAATTNFTYQVKPGAEAFEGLKAEMKANREAWGKAKIAAADETVLLAEGVYEGVSLEITPWNKASTLHLKGESPSGILFWKSEGTVFSGRGAKGCAYTFNGVGTNIVEGITFRDYRNEEGEGAVIRRASVGSTGIRWLVKDCRFYDNFAAKGGAAYCGQGGHAAGVSFDGCTFERNASYSADALMKAYGDLRWQPPQTRVDNCVFKDNSASSPGDRLNWDWSYVDYERGNLFSGAIKWGENNTFGKWSRYVPMGEGKQDVFTVKPGDDLAAVLASVRRLRTGGGKPAELVFEDGYYEFTNTLALTGRDSGLVLRAKNPGKVTFAGGPAFKGSAFKPFRGEILGADLPEATVAKFRGFTKTLHWGAIAHQPQFTVNGTNQVVSCWPNLPKRCWISLTNIQQIAVHDKLNREGKVVGLTTNKVFKTFTGREMKWQYEDSYIWGYLPGCAYDPRSVRITPAPAGMEGFDMGTDRISWGSWGCFTVRNVPEEIDAPGEWAYDYKAKKLLYWPKAGFSADSDCVLGTLNQSFLNIKADNLKVLGIRFSGSRSSYAVTISECTGVELAGCFFSGMHQGVELAGFRNTIRSCDFLDMNECGVRIYGGRRKELEFGENRVDNCLFRGFGNYKGGCSSGAIWLDGVGNTVTHCDMEDSLEHAVEIGGNCNTLEYTHMAKVSKEYGDSGAVYVNGQAGHGCVIRYNDISASPGMINGVYLDDFCCGAHVYGNVIRDIGTFAVFIGGGRNLTIENNLILTSWGGLHLDNRGLWWPAWSDRDGTWKNWCKVFGLDSDSPFAKRFPYMTKWYEHDGKKMMTAPLDNVYRDNLMIDLPGYSSSFFVCLNKEIPEGRTVYEGNMIVRTKGREPGRPDLATGDSSLAPTNEHSSASSTFRAFGPIKVVDGTPEKPIDVGFKKLPKITFAYQDYLWEQQGWVNTDKLRALREKGLCDNLEPDSIDLTLVDKSFLKKEMPNFKPSPWSEIGLYKDEWRK